MPEFNYHESTDEQLVELIKQNDHEAFKQLFQKYFKALIHFAWYRLYSMDTARDLVQETFYRVWLNRHRLDPSKSVKAYFYKSLGNLIINHKKLHASLSVPLENIISETSENSIDDFEFQMDILKSLNQLPEKLKTVYMLSRFDGFNYTEIAEICNISKKAVEKRMSKTFTILRKTFSKKYFD